MQVPLNSMRIKCRAEFLWNKILVINDIQFRCRCVQPFRKMPPCHKMNFTYPRSKLLHTTEPVLKVIPVSVSLFSVICRWLQPTSFKRLSLFLLPRRITAIYPGNHKVDSLCIVQVFHSVSSHTFFLCVSISYLFCKKYLGFYIKIYPFIYQCLLIFHYSTLSKC